VSDDKPAFDSNVLFRVVLCVFLGACLYLYITNNHLFTTGSYHLQHPEAWVMFAVLGVPFVLAVVHLVRGQRRQG
jgi:hypothetical protein